MIPQHTFIFSPGEWLGEGTISFSASPEKIRFYTRWVIEKEEKGGIRSFQEVEMEGVEDHVHNSFRFFDKGDKGFKVELRNNLVGIATGKGIINEKTLAWEFHGHNEIEGYETYKLLSNGDYELHAEYASADLFRTIIDGRIWQKSKE